MTTARCNLFQMYGIEWTSYSSDSYKSLKCSSNTRGRLLWEWFSQYALGASYLLFVIEIIKVIVGEPRPHFLDTCRPKENINCTNDA